MRLLTTILALISNSALLHADDVKKSEGIWHVVSITDDGKRLPDATAQRMKVTIAANQYTVQVGDKIVERCTFVLDPSRNPGAIDATVTEGADRGNTSLGIYVLGDQIRQVCLAPPGAARPTRFEAIRGSKWALFVTHRQTREEAARGDLERMQGRWQMISMEREGKKLPDPLVKTYKRIVKENEYRVTWVEDGQPAALNTVMTLDPRQNPKAIDILLGNGQLKGKKRLGIYRIDGDTETVCLAQPGKARPTRFDSSQGGIHVWTRTKD
jgi:uncharacterized protein (TIGR03067 family)